MYSGVCFIIGLPKDIEVSFTMDHRIRLKFNSSLKQVPEFNAKVSSKNNLLHTWAST